MNNTKFTHEEILNMKALFRVKSLWRQRDIVVYEHPNDPMKVISVGTPFNGGNNIICEDYKTQWNAELEKGHKFFIHK